MSDTIPSKILNSKKYGNVCPDTVQRIWDECSLKYKKSKDAERAVRETLHGITGAFLTPSERTACENALRALSETGDEAYLEKVLSTHSSTRERLPLSSMDSLIAELGITSETSVLDLACGIHPIFLASRGINVVGTDISGDAVQLINFAGSLFGQPCRAVCKDLLCGNAIPDGQFDFALLFKVLPLLERQKKGSSESILKSLPARRIIVSFPTKTLSGRNVGMESHYTEWMNEHIPDGKRISASYTTRNEIYFTLETEADP